MAQQPSNITKLEWVTCPFCSGTFQIAVPTKATDMRTWPKKPHTFYSKYCLSVRCVKPSCSREFWIETDLPYSTTQPYRSQKPAQTSQTCCKPNFAPSLACRIIPPCGGQKVTTCMRNLLNIQGQNLVVPTNLCFTQLRKQFLLY